MTATTQGYDAPALDDLTFLADEVWRSLLGEEEMLVPVGCEDPIEWSGAVSVTGGWQGTVTVELGARAAADLTARMLALPEDEPAADADVADAVGELVNMIGGNVKSLMPGPSVLSLPAVAAGRAVFANDVVEVCRVDVAWRGGPVRICIHVPNPAHGGSR